MPGRHTSKKPRLMTGALILIGLALVSLAFNLAPAAAQSPLHPSFPLLDGNGENVLASGAAVSTLRTCGACHDTAFIQSHSFHADAGLGELGAAGEASSGRAWDTSPGLFGKWNAIPYRYLSSPGDELLDLGTADWLRTIGLRHVGGGPAVYSLEGGLLTDLEIIPGDPETHVLDPESGQPVAWDWSASGVVEMNCFLCHLTEPDNAARIESLKAGQFQWANTATLASTGIVTQIGEAWAWNPEAFDGNGELAPAFVTIQDPDSSNCGQCHGLVYDAREQPLTTPGCVPDAWTTQTTGQIISAQRLADSGMNLANKDELSRAWDIHAERLVECTDCHFSLNNPIYAEGSGEDSLESLDFDPRRLDMGEYLLQPSHEFARGQSAQSTVAPELKGSMRRCESCHSLEAGHEWLPYSTQHMAAVNCETCHIPQLYTAAFQQYDWTVIQPGGLARTQCRGVEGDSGTVSDLVTGYEPVIMPRQELDGTVKLSPYNLVTSWFWVYGEPARPVRQIDLEAAWLEEGEYRPEVVSAFDQNGDGLLEKSELAIDTPEKEALIAGNLAALGLENPRITAEVQPYSINHDVTGGGWAIDDCQTCHSEESRITQPIQLARYVPGGVMPEFVGGTNVIQDGEFYTGEDGALYFQPNPNDQGVYVLGHNNLGWVDWFGSIFFLGTLGAVVTHGGLRAWVAYRRPKQQPALKRLYMYSFYERLWHWLQTLAILILLFTGLAIHKPEMFGWFSFRGVVLVHNVMGGILVANAFLALFYNLVSGDIQRFIPQPRGFFNQAISQVKFYLRGIFKGEEHPFEKTRERRLNPLQKVTYFGILNVLLPLQVLTGILMWGAQHLPQAAENLGGLPFLAPFHTLVAWLFAAFIVAHVYLTTTGYAPLAGVKSMIMGWDEIETHAPPVPEEA